MTDAQRTAYALADLLRDTEYETGGAEGSVGGRDLVRAALVLRHRRRAQRRLTFAAAALLIGMTFAAGWSASDLGESSTTSAALDGAVLVTPAGSSTRMELADGTLVELHPDSNLRIEEQGDEVRGVLAAGAVTVSIPEGSSQTWKLATGPFQTRLESGKLALAWAQGGEKLAVDLYEGEAEVGGPLEGEHVTLRAGQRLRVDGRTGRISLTPLIEAERLVAAVAPSAGVDAPAGGTVPSTEEEAETEPAASAAAPSAIPWAALVGKGDFDAVLRAAEARGLERCLGSCSAGDLRALALAARYAGRASLAQRGWQALRGRFAGSGPAADGAFFLARQAESAGQHAAALRWYDAYLSEAPGGRYAADALGGKMLATARSAGNAAAKPIARAYLERYPSGVHAGGARRILGPR